MRFDPNNIGHALRAVFVGVAAAVALVGCSTGGPSPSPIPSPNATPSAPSGAVIVTLRVVDAEDYRILLTEPDDIAIARDLLAGREAPGIPNGRVIRGDPGVNAGYSWQIDPADFAWADVTMELCDGRPSDVERNQVSGDRFCPWMAKVIAVDPAP